MTYRRASDPRRPVLVGVDGSQGSAQALAWALGTARARCAPVHVITAWAWDTATVPGVRGGTVQTRTPAARRAGQAQEALVRAVVAAFPGVVPALRTELVQGDPASTLIERSAEGDLVVLGSRGLTARDDEVLGSVADACLRHCRCPVVVVPTRPRAEQRRGVPQQSLPGALAPAARAALAAL